MPALSLLKARAEAPEPPNDGGNRPGLRARCRRGRRPRRGIAPVGSHPHPPAVRALAPLGLLLLLGCNQLDTGYAARQRIFEVLDCPEEETEVAQLGAYRYRGEGCGRALTVACTAQSLEPECVPERSAGGEVAATIPRDLEARYPEDEPLGDSPREGPPRDEPPAAAPDAEVEALIRAGLDARRDDILACVGAELVAVRAGYAPDGSVALSLRGSLAGSPEEGCVQDALDGVRVPARGEAGVVIHLVRAAP